MKTNKEKAVMKTSRIKDITAALKKGGVVILPTDTVYGIFCSALSKKGVSAVYKIKGRDNKKPLQVFLSDVSSIHEYAEITPAQEIQIGKMLPGPYTLILKLNPSHKRTFSFLKTGTIGVRVIKSDVLSSILKEMASPLAATSANISGQPFSACFWRYR